MKSLASVALLFSVADKIGSRFRLAEAFHPALVRPSLSRPKSCPPFVVPLYRDGTTLCSSTEDEYILDASNVELLQDVFSKYADKDGLMTKLNVMQVPAIAQLLVSTTHKVFNIQNISMKIKLL